MNNYPKQLIRELSEHLDLKIVDFFMHTKENYDYPVDSLFALVEFTMENLFNDATSKDALDTLYFSEVNNRKQIRQQWLHALEKNPHILSSDKSIKKLYQDAKNWQQNIEALLIDFPALDLLSSEEIFRLLQSDVLISVCKYVYKNYDGAIDGYFVPFPTELLNIPIFSPVVKDTNLISFFTFIHNRLDKK